MKITSKISLEVESEKQAVEKLEAFAKMNDSLEHEELTGLAEFVEEYPNTVSFIKETLPKLKNKSGLELVGMSGSLISGIRNALKNDGYSSED